MSWVSFSVVVSAPFDLNAYLRASLPPVSLSGRLYRIQNYSCRVKWSLPILTTLAGLKITQNTSQPASWRQREKQVSCTMTFCHSQDLGIYSDRTKQVASAEMPLTYYHEQSFFSCWVQKSLMHIQGEMQNTNCVLAALVVQGGEIFFSRVRDFYTLVSNMGASVEAARDCFPDESRW